MLIEEMSQTDCLRILAGARLGRLACVRENQPYVVPIYFVHEEPYLYGFTTPGLKVECMRSNPLVCVELDEVAARDQWMSIVVFGKYEELPGGSTEGGEEMWLYGQEPLRRTARPQWASLSEQERRHAQQLLQRHAGWWEPGCASDTHRHSEQPLTPVFYRICIDRITGRRTTPGPGDPVSPGRPLTPARDNPGWLLQAFCALTKPFASRRRVETGRPDGSR
jgi:nitroimidazol reductase NimA-like FMN-containing flavoprotein (pyridoxamine 5'-phosphate oxidase superfamily)